MIIRQIDKDDLNTILEYSSKINFNTPEKHVPLHNDLFDKHGVKFDIHTRGEMPTEILQIFSKLGIIIYEEVSNIEKTIEYHPPMFSKNYIARYRPGVALSASHDPSKPNKTYKACMFWQFSKTSKIVSSMGIDDVVDGTLVIYEDTPDNILGFSESLSTPILISEFWLSPIGTAPFSNVVYDALDWDDWEIKGF